ncbi:MAG: hypothetical protein R6V83_10355 [Candidatus Thorarchaeota archaeon]
MKLQITLTVPEAKQIIAKAIAERADVKNALNNGQVLLKGGTTVSAISEELVGEKLRIGGRITSNGTKNALEKHNQSHSLLISQGKVRNADNKIEQITGDMQRSDVIITSANALDADGNAAMMAAAPLGHKAGKAISGFASQGCKVIVAVGLEKLIPGSIRQAVLSAGRESIDKALGSAVGLIPIIGEVFTEKEAVMSLADVKATVISSGGIYGAEGATTMVVSGQKEDVETIYQLVLEIKGTETSGTPESLIECRRGCPQCKRHLACVYKLGYLEEDEIGDRYET